jgi:hypothetical protein
MKHDASIITREGAIALSAATKIDSEFILPQTSNKALINIHPARCQVVVSPTSDEFRVEG